MRLLGLVLLACRLLVFETACDGGVQNTGGAGGQGAGGQGAQPAAGGQGEGATGGVATGGASTGGQGVCDSSWKKIEECFGEVGDPPRCADEWVCISGCIAPLNCDQIQGDEGAMCATYCQSPCAQAADHLAACGVDSAGVDCSTCAGSCAAQCIAAASCGDLAGGATAICTRSCAARATPCTQLQDKLVACGLTDSRGCEEVECAEDVACFATCVLPASCDEVESVLQPCAEECGFGQGGAGGGSSTVSSGAGASGGGG